MKTRLLATALAAGILFAAPTHAAPRKPLLSQTITSGTVSPAYQTRTECEIYQNMVVVTQHAGNISSTTKVKAALKGNIRELITAAGAGQISTEPGSVGGPTENDLAYKANGEVVVLKQTGGLNQTNQAEAAATLINFLNLSCQ